MRIHLRWFKWDFGLAGAALYACVIVVANFDKSWNEIFWLAARQATVSFLVTGTLLAWVLRQSRHASLMVAVLSGVVLPAVLVSINAFVAHWYFTHEMRNILVPLFVSLVLNSIAVFGGRAGHATFLSQARFLLGKLKRPS